MGDDASSGGFMNKILSFAQSFSVQESQSLMTSTKSQERSERRAPRHRVDDYKQARARQSVLMSIEADEDREANGMVGEEALLRNIQAVKDASRGKLKTSGLKLGGKEVSPIARHLDRCKVRLEVELEQQSTLKLEEPPVKTLAAWFDGGLHVDPVIGLTGKLALPEGYGPVVFADEVPLFMHVRSRTIVWPVRLDLMPFFQSLDVEQDAATRQRYKLSRTVYHYTSGACMRQIVRPTVEESVVQEPHEWGEEIWDRLVEDLNKRNIPDIPEAPDFHLPFIDAEPKLLETRSAMLQAVYRSEKPLQSLAAVGYCMAVLVPMESCMAVPGRWSTHTIVVVPSSGAVGDSDVDDVGDVRGTSGKAKLQSWALKASLLRLAPQEQTLDEQVQELELLDNVVDRATGNALVKLTCNNNEPEPVHPGSGGARREEGQTKTRKSVMELFDEQEEECTKRYEALQEKRQGVLQKIEVAERAQQRYQAGKKVRMLLLDQHRLANLKKSVLVYDAKVKAVQAELEEFQVDIMVPTTSASGETNAEQADVVASSTAAAGGGTIQGDPPPPPKPRRQRRRNKADSRTTEFSHDVKGSVNEISDQFEEMSGDIFRDVFGGCKFGVAAYFRSNGDPNVYSNSTGWTPLLMATSAGDPEMVQLIIDNGGDASLASKRDHFTPLHIACMKCSSDVAKVILQAHEYAVKDVTVDGSTPLLKAVESAPVRVRDEMVQLLVEAQSDPNAMNMLGWTPTSLAVCRNYRSVVRFLISNRGSVFEECPETDPKITVWQMAHRHHGLQQLIKGKLSSRDMQILERRFPGTLGKKTRGHRDD
eukprot:TRINITY_DN38194_c0_g1_i1.p1 TRINITY_DN38194_c0_g1~~TRINITY_DN38194_c0_g1_i1.p1  ORF type:complete len:819 (-),score=145.47 TRINITY_DN38194_c0_g1_i1:171-2627(-)